MLADANAVIARVEGMKATDAAHESTVKELDKLIDLNVMVAR